MRGVCGVFKALFDNLLSRGRYAELRPILSVNIFRRGPLHSFVLSFFTRRCHVKPFLMIACGYCDAAMALRAEIISGMSWSVTVRRSRR